MEGVRCSPRSGVRCRAIVGDTKRLLQILFTPHRIQNPKLRFSKIAELADYLKEFFNPRTRYYVFAWDDCKPFFADLILSTIEKLSTKRLPSSPGVIDGPLH
jgi:hypothetical protein